MTHRLLRASATFLAPRGRSIRPASVLAACAALTAASALAQTTDPAATATAQRILASPAFQTAVATLDKEHGRIVEDGPHDDLIHEPEGRYRALFETQAAVRA